MDQTDDTEKRLAEWKRVFGDDDNVSDRYEQYDKAFDKAALEKERVKEIDKEIDTWQALVAETVSEESKRKKKLNTLKKEKERILKNRQFCSMPTSKAQLVQSGRRKSPLTEAVEHAYNLLHESGNIESIKPGRIDRFMEYLKECTTEGNSNENDFISERIKSVKKVGGKWKITMHPLTDSQIVKQQHTGKTESFDKSAVSTILTRLRGNRPLPT